MEKYRNEEEKIVTQLVYLLQKSDIKGAENILADDLVSYVTNSKGGIDEVGKKEYIKKLEAMDIASAKMELDITQIVTIAPKQIMMMLVVRAKKNNRELLNHAAYLIKFNNANKIKEMWMVEALPAYSDEFWH